MMIDFRFFLVMIFSQIVASSKILFYVGCLPMGSHVRVANFWANSLSTCGHDVYSLIPDVYYERRVQTDKNKAFSYLTIPVNYTAEEVNEVINSFLEKSANGETSSFFATVNTILSTFAQNNESNKFTNALQVSTITCDIVLKDAELLKRIQKENFDLLVGDSMLPCHHVLAERLHLPYVTMDTPPILPSLVSKLHVPSNPAYVPEGYSHLTDKMSFFERVKNSFLIQFVPFIFDIIVHQPIQNIAEKYSLNNNKKNLFSNVGIWFGVNCHPALEFPRPITNNIVCTRGMLSTPANPILDNELLSFIESAERGVILISMGSTINISSNVLLESFASAFARLPYKVIWRYTSNVSPPSLGNNTKLMSWIPQNDLLGHPNVKAMMYHGGINGVYQAVYHGTPVIGIPMYQDQHDNIARLVAHGMAEVIDINTLTSESLYQTIMKVVSNKRYGDIASLRSKIMRDTVHIPQVETAKWMEHMIKFGSDHLQSGAKSLTFIEYYLIDSIAILMLLCLVILMCLYRGVKLLVRKIYT
ncbi:2-hydroxyacylsphingosine 1-beta-galactosyltransferase-like [Antedon mediterranea]|uniref:2-hydroxyacylsphingosine 1-beta-galactosyltransferase-like n=1 Tax=Antedon mediterranea TaxID=105859 RepID=UPI003AF8B02B